jgi:polyisoprenoid-binding protein YceI
VRHLTAVAHYRIVPERSTASIEARSNVHPIRSRTNGLEGFVDLEMGRDGTVDLSAATAARLSLPVNRLSSGNGMEDREMQRRIDARRYPTIDGVLDRLEPAGTDSTYLVSGDVTLRGVSCRHQDRMTIRLVDAHTIALAGKSRFDIREFGIEPPRILLLRVEPEVDVQVDIVAVEEG